MKGSRMRYAALLRGVNVGGGNKVPMAELRALATGLGWTEVQSYIASGNLVFKSEGDDLAATLAKALRDGMGVDVPVQVWSRDQITATLDDCPFPKDAGKTVHGFFCDDDPTIDAQALDGLIAPSEQIEARGRVVWMFAPDGFGRSKLAAKVDKVITGCSFTARNLNTIHKLAEMLDG